MTAKAVLGAIKQAKEPPPPKPRLVIRPENRPATVLELSKVLASKGDLFNQSDELVQVLRGDDGVLRTKKMTYNNVIVAAHELVQPVQIDAKGKPTAITLPDTVARMYLDLGVWNVPSLAGISTTPLLRADGSITVKSGYDGDTQTWCDCNLDLDIPKEPTIEDAGQSLDYIRWTYRTFPFADSPMVPSDHGVMWVDTDKPPEMDESSFLASLLTACCRPSIWLAPGLVITAPTTSGSGSGKGLLARAICKTAFTYDVSPSTRGHDRTEMEKRLVAALINGDPVVFIDNINGAALRTETLANVMTERPAKVRLLGSSKSVLLNSAAFVVLTGNGLTLSEDLGRRYLKTQLDPKVEDAESRPFKSGFLDGIKKKRVRLLGEVFTILRWGRLNAGKLKRGTPLGSYEPWTEWVRDPLLALGCRDPVEAMLKAKADDPQRRAIGEMLELWFKRHQDDPVAARELDPDVMDLLNPGRRGRQWVAQKLISLNGTRAGGYVLASLPRGGKWSAAHYTVKKVDLATSQVDAPIPPMNPMPRDTFTREENERGASSPANPDTSARNGQDDPAGSDGIGHRVHRGHRDSADGSDRIEHLYNRSPAEKRRRAAAMRRRIRMYDEMDKQ